MIRPSLRSLLSPTVGDTSHLRRWAAALAFIGGLAPAGCGGHVVTGGGACEVDGVTHQVGDSFRSSDGCNMCTCEEGGGVACTEMACDTSCVWEGQTHQVGDSFPAGDGCNTCSCEPGGFVGCTLMACVAECTWMGQVYTEGQSFPAGDGCNTCTCQGPDEVSCTQMACTCDPEKEWYRDYVSTDPMTCAVIDFACPPNTTGFENACGCGCEQDPSCPQYFDCMPPAMCDFEALKEQCPYSGFAL